MECWCKASTFKFRFDNRLLCLSYSLLCPVNFPPLKYSKDRSFVTAVWTLQKITMSFITCFERNGRLSSLVNRFVLGMDVLLLLTLIKANEESNWPDSTASVKSHSESGVQCLLSPGSQVCRTYFAHYGDISRISPSELSSSHPDNRKDIMGHQKSGRENTKAAWFYQSVKSMPKHIANEPREEHGRLRRQLVHGFSERGIREQQPIIKHYVDLFI